MFSRITLKRRMTVIGLISLAGLLIVAIWAAIAQRSVMYADRMDMLKTVIESAQSQILYYQGLEKQGTLSSQEAEHQAREALRSMRFQGDNYVFIFDHAGITVLLPPLPDQEGKSRLALKDAHGVAFVHDIVEAGKAGGGFTRYDFPRAGQTDALPKIAYAVNIDGWDWILSAGIYVDDIDTAFHQRLLITALVILVLGALVFGSIAVISRSVLQQIGGEPAHAMKLMKRVAEGDLTVTVESHTRGSLLDELNLLVQTLRQLIMDIHSGAGDIHNASQHIRQSSDEVAQAATTQASATQSMAAAMEELTVSISHISENATETERFASETTRSARHGEQQVNDAARSMGMLTGALDDAVARINELDIHAHEVGSIAATIKEIAAQTSLLALNAAIEAARAGETGRGFSVVADEVRKLAERTTSATAEIEQTLSAIQTETESAVQAMHNAAGQATQSADEVSQTSDILQKIAEGATQAEQLVADVASAAREQQAASTALAQQVENIAQATEETSSSMAETAASANNLELVAVELNGSLSRFHC